MQTLMVEDSIPLAQGSAYSRLKKSQLLMSEGSTPSCPGLGILHSEKIHLLMTEGRTPLNAIKKEGCHLTNPIG
jgi:hypothetical protein